MKIGELIMKYHIPYSCVLTCFLSGGMTGLTKEERTKWRSDVRIHGIYFIDPTIFDPDNSDPEYQQKGYEYCIEGIINCDFVIVNLDNQTSVGTAQEIMLAWLLSKPIIGLYTKDEPLHPWYKNKLNVLYDNIDELKIFLHSWKYAWKYNKLKQKLGYIGNGANESRNIQETID